MTQLPPRFLGLEERLALAETELAVLADFGQSIHGIRDLPTLYRGLFEQARRVMEVDAAFIALLLPDGSKLQTVYSLDKGAEYAPGQPWDYSPARPTGWVVHEARALRFADLPREAPARFSAYGGPDSSFGDQNSISRSWMTVPMLIDQAVKGVVNVQSYAAGVYGPHEERLLVTLAGMLAIAISQYQLIERLEATRVALGAPAIPVNDDLVIVPLLGRLDASRIELIQQTLLPAIQQRRIANIVLDLTAVTQIEPASVAALLRLVRTLGLLGSRCILSGVQSGLSRDLLKAGVDLAALSIVRDVRQAVKTAKQSRNGKGSA